MNLYESLTEEEIKKVKDLAERLRKKGITCCGGEIVRMAAYEWYDMIGDADVDVYYDYDDDDIFTDICQGNTFHVFDDDVVLLFTLEENWYHNWGPSGLEREFDDEELEKIQEMKEEGYEDFEILRELGYDPREWIADWLEEEITGPIGSLEEFLIEYAGI